MSKPARRRQGKTKSSARKRWSARFGFAPAPDTNLGGSSDERVIYIYGLPFQRDADELTTSGIGLSIWTGGEYQHPLSDRWRLRAGAEASRREYGGRLFDQTFLSAHSRALAWKGFSPQVSVVREVRKTNAQLYDYERTSGELRFVKLF